MLGGGRGGSQQVMILSKMTSGGMRAWEPFIEHL